MSPVQIRTDDEVYRVDAVWLGPPRATFPWRARYASYGVGLLVMIAVMFVQRRLGISLGFFSVAWALLVTVAVTRFVGKRIDEDRPLLEWLTLFVHELRGPRTRTATVGGPLRGDHVRVRPDLPAEAPRPPRAPRPARIPGRPRPAALPAAGRTAPAVDDGFGPPSAITVGATPPPADRPRAQRPARTPVAARDGRPVRAGRTSRPERRAPVRVRSDRPDRPEHRDRAGSDRAGTGRTGTRPPRREGGGDGAASRGHA